MSQVITGQETGVWKMQEGRQWPWSVNRSADIDWSFKLKGTSSDSPSNLSSSCSITERLSEKYCVISFCRSAGQPGLGSEVAKTSVIVFFFYKTKYIHVIFTDKAQWLPLHTTTVVFFCNSRCRHTHLPLFFWFSWFFILSLFLLRNYTLFLWKQYMQNTQCGLQQVYTVCKL